MRSRVLACLVPALTLAACEPKSPTATPVPPPAPSLASPPVPTAVPAQPGAAGIGDSCYLPFRI